MWASQQKIEEFNKILNSRMKSRLRKRRDMKKKSNTVESLSSISSESSDSEGDDSGESASSSGSDEE